MGNSLKHCIYSIATLAVFISCTGDSGPTQPIVPWNAAIVSGNQQVGLAGESLSEPISIRLISPTGDPAAGRHIRFLVTYGGGSVATPDVITDDNGIASTEWTLGTSVADSHQVQVQLLEDTADVPYVLTIFRATAEPNNAQLATVGGNGQVAVPGTMLPDSLLVRILDQFGNPVVNRNVEWTVTDGAGTITPVSPFTDDEGYTAAKWTLGSGIGVQKVSVSAEGMAAVEFVAVAEMTSSDIAVKVGLPAQNSLVGDTLSVVVDVTSTYEIASVTAAVGNRETPLSYLEVKNYWLWRGKIVLADLPNGTYEFLVTATDIRGNVTVKAVSFHYNQSPRLVVTGPGNYDVATPALDIDARCVNPDPGVCVEMRATANGDIVASGTSSIQSTVSLSAYAGRSVDFKITVKNAGGLTATFSKTLLVVNTENVQLQETVNGLVLDVSGNRVLFVDTLHNKSVFQIKNGSSTTVIFEGVGTTVRSGYLTPFGAIFSVNTSLTSSKIVEYRSGTLLDLSQGQDGALYVNGTFALWYRQARSPSFQLRDLSTGITTAVGANAANINYTVDLVGNVAYWTTDYRVVLEEKGEAPVFISPNNPAVRNVSPVIGGGRIAYTRSSNQLIVWSAEAGESSLGTIAEKYMINNGWLAYAKPGNVGSLQTWISSPAGNNAQVSQFNSRSWPEVVGANGDVVFKNDQRGRYLSKSPYSTVIPLGGIFGTTIWRDGAFYILMSNKVFRAD